MTETGIGWLALATSLLAASTYSSFAKLLSPALSPLSLIFVSECIVLLFILLSFGAMPVARTYVSLKRREIFFLLLVGILSGIMGPGLWFYGLTKTTAVNAGFFGKAEIVFMLMCATFVFREKITRAHVTAMFTILAGMTVISFKGFTHGLSMQIGDLIIIGGALSFAVSSIVVRKYLRHMPPHITIASRSMIALTIFFLVSPFVHHTFIEEALLLPAALIPALIGFGFISRFINGVMAYEALDRLPVSTISLMGSLDIVLSTTVAFLMLGEQVHWYHFVGGAFIILGTLLLELLGTHPTDKDLEHHVRQRIR